jgi:ABC-type sugar transport system substrate-binding protein
VIEKYNGDSTTQVWLGAGSYYYDAMQTEFKEKGVELKDNIMIAEYIHDMARRLAASDLVISRSGALTVAEVAVSGVPAVFVPFPDAAGNHQYYNAMAVAENILTANPDIDIFYGINYDTGMGAVSAIQAANSNAIVLCAGWASEGFEMLEADDPTLKVMCANVPVVQAKDTVDAITKLFNGEELPQETLSMPMLLDASNIHDYDWKSIVDARMN